MHTLFETLQPKIKDLLLNKVEGLPWNYFHLDLNQALGDSEVYVEEKKIRSFFDHIKLTSHGSYEFKTSEKQPEIPKVSEIVKILFTLIDLNPKLLPSIIRSLFKNNHILNESGADEGAMGRFNLRNREAREELFQEKIASGFRGDPDNILVLAEGDSWFQFPRIHVIDPVKDIIDWMIDDKRYAVKSLAAGGDWLSNIFYAGEYVEELPKLSPDVFLISGGGNDLVGNNRLAVMVRNPRHKEQDKKEDTNAFEQLKAIRAATLGKDSPEYARFCNGLRFVSPEFFKFLNIYMVQYFVFLYNIATHPKYKQMLILTQGYDYVIPYHKNRGTIFSPVHLAVNAFTGTSKWLYYPLCMKGITDAQDQVDVVYVLIHEFNEMLIQLAEFQGLPTLFHIDCRGVAADKDWFDELHLKSHAYERITNTFKQCIEENRDNPAAATKKVYKVA